jgi:hypothetical protein
MRAHVIGCVSLLLLGNAIAADMPRLKTFSCKPNPASPGRPPTPPYLCRQDFNASCAKGSLIDPFDPGEGGGSDLLYPPPKGYQFVPGTGQCVISEQKGSSYLVMRSSQARWMQVAVGCQANRVDDAFVYGYCTSGAIRIPLGK